jgi:Protein of unknown function (DUF3500)
MSIGLEFPRAQENNHLNMKHVVQRLLILLALSPFGASFGQDLSGKANDFLATLTPELLSKANYPVKSDERLNWNIIPRTRQGATFREFNDQQRNAALALLKASLSDQGYTKATGIMQLENVLREIEGRNADDTYRDPLNYFFTIFGTPSKEGPWGWRLEGHHVSLNFFSIDGTIVSSTPSAFGSNPGIVTSGAQKGKEVLKLETDLGFAMVNALSASQLQIARFSETAPPEMITLGKRDVLPLEPKGLTYGEMTEAQKKKLMQLLDVYVKNYAFGFSSRLMDKINKAGIQNLSFAWAGSLKPGAGHYYRIQGPMLLIEYDNTQNNANHVHTAVRDLTDDFAYDVLREHYEREHK